MGLLATRADRHPLQAFQKDAILRRMKESQRDTKTAKEELETERQKARNHDEHLRVVDGWFSQLVDEISIICRQTPSAQRPSHFNPFDSSLLVAKSDLFQQHLKHKADLIKQAVSQIFSLLPCTDPDTQALQERIAQLLAAEKQHEIQRQGLEDQAASLDERLENASMRYMMAEKKVDRLKSLPVQKLEAQAKQAPKMDQDEPTSSTVKAEEPKQVNGIPPESSAEAEGARREAVVARDKLKEQCTSLTEQNRKLLDDLTAARSKIATLSDDDYSHTELYKTLRSQHGDVIKRVNDLQAVNTHLRAEIKQLQSERTKYREEVDKEQETAIKDSESQVTRLGLDLARIRNERDNAQQDLQLAKAEKRDSSESSARSAEVTAAREARITVLESEVERLQLAKDANAPNDGDALSEPNVEELRDKLRLAQSEKQMLMQELTGMESSYKKAIAAASQKLGNALSLEEQLMRASAEKAKCEQKYYQSERTKESQLGELRALKSQQAKTSEIVAQSKETDLQRRALITQMEKQVADLRDSLATVEKDYRDRQQSEYDFKTKSERLSGQVEELHKQSVAKDDTIKTAQETSRQGETELAELKVRLEETQKSLETWRKRGMGAKNDEYEMLKQIATCTICRKNFKEVALTKCGHVFCQQCVDERYNSRARKCPNCSLPFGQNDRIKVTL